MARPTWDTDGAERSRPMSPVGRALCFVLFVGGGLGTLAAVVVLPEYAALAELHDQRDALARHLESDKRLAIYNDRLIHAIQNDPVVAARLLMRHGNYRLAGCEKIAAAAQPQQSLSVPARLRLEAMTPPARAADPLCQAGRWLDEGRTKFSLLALAIGAIAVGMLLFGPRGADRRV